MCERRNRTPEGGLGRGCRSFPPIVQAKVFVRGEPSKWGQKMVVPGTWDGFVTKTRERLELPVDK